MLTSRFLLIYAVLTMAGCAQQRLTHEEYLVSGLEACQVAMDAIKSHPDHKKLRYVVKKNFKNYKKTKQVALNHAPKAITQYNKKITECETTVNAFLNKKQIERKKKAAKKREDLLKLTVLNNKKITELALKQGYKGVYFTGISQFISSVIDNPNEIQENRNHVFTLTNQDGMFVVSQIISDAVVYQVDTSKAPYDLVNIIYPYGERLSDVVIIQPKHKGNQYFIGQKMGVNEKEKYFVFAGTKEYETRLGGMNTAFVFNRAFK